MDEPYVWEDDEVEERCGTFKGGPPERASEQAGRQSQSQRQRHRLAE